MPLVRFCTLALPEAQNRSSATRRTIRRMNDTHLMNQIRTGALPLCAAVALIAVVVSASASAQSQTPTEVFQAYRAALAKATSYAEVLPFMEAKGRGMIETLPEQPRAGMFGLLKKFAATYSDVAVTRESVTGDTAVLALGGKDPKGQPATGSVPMVKEASGWKVGTEKWSSAPR